MIPRAVLLFALAATAPAEQWLRMSSPNFELFTDTRDRDGRTALENLEQVRHVFHLTSGIVSPLPVRVYLFRSEAGYRPFRPSDNTSGFYQGGPQRNYIVLQSVGAGTRRVLFHEYAHLALNHASAPLPRWLEEGTAEFYSTLEADAESLRMGLPVPSHLATLARHRWLDAATLLSVRKDSAHYNDRAQAIVFYAQSWALVHMLRLRPGSQERFGRLAALLDQGAAQPEAFREAFGQSLQKTLEDLERYVAEGRFEVFRMAWTPPPPVTVTAEPITEEAADLALAEVPIQTGRLDLAEKLLRKRRGVPAAEMETALGELAMSRRDYDQARQHLDKAIALGSRQASTFFEYAMLLRDTGGDRARVAGLLRQVVELDPNYAEAHFLLGLMASQEGRHDEAIPMIERAAAILPRQSYFWHALAMAYHHTGDARKALRAARRAREAAVRPQEVEMAAAAVRLAESPAAAPAVTAGRPAVTTPQGWSNRQGDSRIEGLLERIDCLGASARFHIRAGGKVIPLFVAKPGEVLLARDTSLTFEFRCGPQKLEPVVVDYLRGPDAATRSEGEITAIEFKTAPTRP